MADQRTTGKGGAVKSRRAALGRSRFSIMVCGMSLFFLGCNQSTPVEPAANAASTAGSTVLLSVTKAADQDTQSVDMALKLAGFAVDEGRDVAMFFNVKGVQVPVANLPEDLAFQENSPLKEQLATLIERGVDVHVCPICMAALSVEESDLMTGAKVTTRSSLFAHIGPDTAVFTY